MGDDKEREGLLADVGRVMEQKLRLHHTVNGYVTKDTFDASTKVMTKALGSVTDVVEKVHKEMGEQRRATDALGKKTDKLSVDLIAHTAEHRGKEKAEGKQSGKWKMRIAVAGLVLTILVMLGGGAAWLFSLSADLQSAKDRPQTIVIDKETAREIAKAVNGKGDDG